MNSSIPLRILRSFVVQLSPRCGRAAMRPHSAPSGALHQPNLWTVRCPLRVAAVAVASLLAIMPLPRAAAQGIADEIAVLRESVRADRTVVVAEAMQLTDAEGAAFWPLYREYRSAMDTMNDGVVKLVLEYADAYPNVTEERAEKMLKDYTVLEGKLAETRAKYLRKVAKVLSSVKALRLAQVENRLDLAVRLQLASAIPLVPVTAK